MLPGLDQRFPIRPFADHMPKEAIVSYSLDPRSHLDEALSKRYVIAIMYYPIRIAVHSPAAASRTKLANFTDRYRPKKDAKNFLFTKRNPLIWSNICIAKGGLNY